MKLAWQRYGKGKVRVLKVHRQGGRHDVTEVSVDVALEGDFETSYTAGDNSKVVATDSIKNTVHILAKQHLEPEIEKFAETLAGHFLNKYPQVGKVKVRITERLWDRWAASGGPSPHTFTGAGQLKPFVELEKSRDESVLTGGVEDWLIMKTTESGFSNFVQDEFRTLPDTEDRILATQAKVTWKYSGVPENYVALREQMLSVMLEEFASRFSPSVQTTLFQMAEAALAAIPEVSEITLAMPNKHYLLINLQPFSMENKNEVFLPTDEPHGQIEATVRREG